MTDIKFPPDLRPQDVPIYARGWNDAAAEIERLRKVLAIEGLSCKVAADIERQQVEIERLRAALLDIGERAHSPIDDDHIWMDKRTTLGFYIDSLALEPKP